MLCTFLVLVVSFTIKFSCLFLDQENPSNKKKNEENVTANSLTEAKHEKAEKRKITGFYQINCYLKFLYN